MVIIWMTIKEIKNNKDDRIKDLAENIIKIISSKKQSPEHCIWKMFSALVKIRTAKEIYKEVTVEKL